MAQFDFEKLDVYRVSIQFIVIANQIIKELPRGNGHLVDQLQRASCSIVLNICEGVGEYSRKDKGRFYRFARRSSTECASILEVCKCLELSDKNKLKSGRELLLRIVAQGLLHYLSIIYPNEIWKSFGSWLRTIRPGLVPSVQVVSMALRAGLLEFLLVKYLDPNFEKFMHEKFDLSLIPDYQMTG